jgi:threonine dehydratase
MPVTIADIALARYRLAPYLQPTPLEAAPGLGAQAWLKLESVNPTHSFKIRGALNAILNLDQAALARGIVAASSGNHAQAVAYAAHQVGARARIAMPAHTPAVKVAGVRRYGAEPLVDPPDYDAAELLGRQLAREQGLTYVSPYNDPDVVAGAGTIGMEIADQLPDVARVLVPVSGGGLISGVAVAIKALRPSAEVIGVAALRSPALVNLMTGSQHAPDNSTLAEALSGDVEVGSITIDLTRRFVDRFVLVDEDAIARAMRWMVVTQGWLVEGGAAVAVAAMQTGAVADDGRPTVLIISGANVDAATLSLVLAGAVP